MKSLLQVSKLFTLVALLFFSFNQTKASHIMGGDLTYVCIGPNQYSIIAKLFRDCDGIALNNTITIDIESANCGTFSVQLSNFNGVTNSYIAPLCDVNTDLCVNNNGLLGIEQYFYRGIVTLPACANGSDYVLSWNDCCRNNIITTGAAGDGGYLYANLNNTLAECNNSPAFNFEPTLYFCLGEENNFNQGVTDIDGDRLQFSFTNCLELPFGATVPQSVNYNTGFSPTNPLSNAGITLNPETGQLTMIPTQLEVGVVCIKVEEFRSNVKIGETIRDLQISVVDCGNNNSPILSGLNGTANSSGVTGNYTHEACVGEEMEFTIQSFDVQGQPGIETQNVKMIWAIGIDGASFIIDDTTSSLPSATFRWTPNAADVGTNFFAVRVEDDNCPLYGSAVYTYKIEVQNSGLNYSTPMPKDTLICKNDSLVIDVNKNNFGPGYQFFWSTNTTDSVLSCYNCEDPVFTPTEQSGGTATYEFYLVYRDISGSTNCVVRDTFIIETEICNNTFNAMNDVIKSVKVAPNPFTTNTTLSYELSESVAVQIELFDMVGRKLNTILNENQNSGIHQIEFGESINSVKGIYFVRLTVGGRVVTKKIVVQ